MNCTACGASINKGPLCCECVKLSQIDRRNDMDYKQRWEAARVIAVEVIKHFEGCRLTSYVLKGETWATIGWGKAIPMAQHPKTITQAEADKLLAETVLHKQGALMREIPATVLEKLTVGELVCILVFRYNVKDQVWLSPKCTTRQALVRGDMKTFIVKHGTWINGDGGPLAGLKRRRRVERDLAEGKTLDSVKKANWYQGLY